MIWRSLAFLGGGVGWVGMWTELGVLLEFALLHPTGSSGRRMGGRRTTEETGRQHLIYISICIGNKKYGALRIDVYMFAHGIGGIVFPLFIRARAFGAENIGQIFTRFSCIKRRSEKEMLVFDKLIDDTSR